MQGMNGNTMLHLTPWTLSHMLYRVDLNVLVIRGDVPTVKYSMLDWRLTCTE